MLFNPNFPFLILLHAPHSKANPHLGWCIIILGEFKKALTVLGKGSVFFRDQKIPCRERQESELSLTAANLVYMSMYGYIREPDDSESTSILKKSQYINKLLFQKTTQ